MSATTHPEPRGLVIFDCDGVLVDSEPISVRIDVKVLAEFGLEMSVDEVVARFVGRSASAIRATIEQHLGRPLPDDWDAPYRGLYEAAFEAELMPVDGIVAALKAIPEPTCVASSSEPTRLRRKLELTGLYRRFEGRIFSAGEVANGKPAPDLFLHAAALMGASPADCVVVEDSRYGVQAARAAGMAALGYAGGVTAAAALRGPGTVVFDDMRALPELIRAARRGP